jgi:uncharacterized protein YraI
VISRTKSGFIVTLLALIVFASIGVTWTQAQEATEEAVSVTMTQAYREAFIFAGPSETYTQLGILPPGLRVEIVERNEIGNWLHVQSTGASRVNGWVMTGFLTLNDDLEFSDVPIALEMADADVSQIEDPRVAALYEVPIISDVSPTMQLIYRRGQALGNDSSTVTKIGDSVTADPIYLAPMSRDDNELGPYYYLQDTLDFFGPDVVQISVAARISLTTYSVFDPMLADGAQCESNETPLDCEYRVRKPSIAFIMFGANDVRHIDVERFDEQMRLIIDETLSKGIIPVLSTFSYDPNAGYWDQALDFNLAVVEISRDYEVPLINLWAAARPLPQYGLDGDDVHMAHSGFRELKYDTGHESWYGVSLRNLLSLRMLEEIRSTLGMK